MTEPGTPLPNSDQAAESPYRVLARKYRPARFDALIGQEALVRTLTNAIAANRLAHAFILTGVRGVGKTTTARIIARALNCVGPDGTGGPTAEPCGACEHCVAIAADRHVDVMEMDAASRTGVQDIRELIEGVRYKPVSARHKVYIIDEVHMLSTSAFNALLKTLEEPPDHVVFVFATTEIRKVPVTVLSRCQRFDLRRVDSDVLMKHFADIADMEGVTVEDEALGMITRAADGSVRDGLSLLDQAIALGGQTVAQETVRSMLGLADRARVLDLMDAAMKGDAPGALDQLADLHRSGADPLVVLRDLLDLTHWLTRVRAVPAVVDDPTLPETDRVRGAEMARSLPMPVLTRCWQILLKGHGEVQAAPAPLQAAEMVLIRLIYAADLPTPGEMVRKLAESAGGSEARPPAAPGQPTGDPAQTPLLQTADPDEPPEATPGQEPVGEAVQAESLDPMPTDFAAAVELFRRRREVRLANHLAEDVHLVRFDPGRIEFRAHERAPRDLANRTGALLSAWTGRRWMVSVSSEQGDVTLGEQRRDEDRLRRERAAEDPLVQAVLETFPGAKITDVKGVQPEDDAGAPDPEADGRDQNGELQA